MHGPEQQAKYEYSTSFEKVKHQNSFNCDKTEDERSKGANLLEVERVFRCISLTHDVCREVIPITTESPERHAKSKHLVKQYKTSSEDKFKPERVLKLNQYAHWEAHSRKRELNISRRIFS